jgi:hypothetical protein
MQDSDTYLAILEEGEEKGQEKATRDSILAVGEERLGMPYQSIKSQLSSITDLARLKRTVQRAAKAASWQEILDTP